MARAPTTPKAGSTTKTPPADTLGRVTDRIPSVAVIADPDKAPLNDIAATRLARLSGVAVAELAKRPVAELADRLRFRLDPALLAYRRVCGRVVKRGPDGTMLPVPFATVHVEDTDCSLLGWFPPGYPWGWYFPLSCKREVIATAKTDACGRFCAWVPRFDIDWVLRWRAQRVCYDVIFERPTLADILKDIDGIRIPERIRWPEPPIPEPDPPPLLRDGGFAIRRVEQLVGRETAEVMVRAERAKAAGAPAAAINAMLAATRVAMAPPMPEGGGAAAAGATTRAMIPDAARLPLARGMTAEMLKQVRPDRWIGPFRRCHTVVLPQWLPVLDVPDITFRVTQDVDNDGAEETIYSEGFFDVRWNSGAIPDVTLEASPIAVAGITCDVPDIACGTVPAVTFAGLMPVVDPSAPATPYHDAVTGYAKRPNRPRASGLDPARASDLPLAAADTPYCGTLQLYGCVEIDNATSYRLLYRHNGSVQVPFTGLTWPLHRITGGSLQTVWQAADATGWYPVRPAAEGWHPARLALNWPTGGFANGLYEVTLETRNAANAVKTATPVGFRIDNSRPNAQFTSLRWRTVGGAWSLPMELVCPVIRRPAGVDIEIEVGWLASANHFRSAFLRGGGCGGSAAPVLVSAENSAEAWHTMPLDTAAVRTAIFRLAGIEPPDSATPGAQVQGAFSFSLDVASRAFNPAGGDGGFEADWFYDPVSIHIVPSLPVAVVSL
ncbi:hypothetical protein [Elioraea sp.]|uniref:hypothetical protein n=1 Tax=Elioraea sp. TaxID=2185103 RepID=UPI0025C3A769|nr:hypothetical protein [Elioraea sp.]